MQSFGPPFDIPTPKLELDTTSYEQSLREAMSLGRQFSSTLIGAFESIAIRGKSLGDVLRSLALRLSDIVLSAALKPLEQGFGNLLGGLLSGGLPFAKGGVIQQGMPVPFASGGVIQSPISFPLANGRLGIAGERGAEAIMPLSRGPDGRLGVAVSGRGGGAVNVTINVQTPDAESFRRSETQLGAMLSRAVSLGQRNL
jgi:phage-related minor tail protein